MLYKPYTSIDEQIRLLETRGVVTNRQTRHILRREGYYAVVNGYKDQFLDHRAGMWAGDDRYLPGTRFDDLYELFRFDRELRELLFGGITLAEAALKAACAHEFTKAHPETANPYLDIDNYDPAKRASATTLINRVFRKILELDGNPRNKGEYGGKAYLKHCMESHDGQVPLWVLANDLSIGQIVWFYQVLQQPVRLAVARSFTDLYADTHAKPRTITIKRLDRIFNRLVFFRNLCAHDERCYCAHYDGRLNESVSQLVHDLDYLLDRQEYADFLHNFETLTSHVKTAIPAQGEHILTAIGIAGHRTSQQRS